MSRWSWLPMVVFLVACGGGGGSSGPSGDLGRLTGIYRHSALGGLWAAPTCDTMWGTLAADGEGGCAIQANTNTDGVVYYDLTGNVTTYDVASDGTWSLHNLGGVPIWRGGLSSDGRAGTLANAVDGRLPRAGLMLRPSGSYSTSSMAGDYHAAHWRYLLASEQPAAGHAEVRLDADGTWAAAGWEHWPTGLSSFIHTGSYLVSADGTLSMTHGANRYAGASLPGGELWVVSGGTEPGQDLALRACVRMSSGLGNSSFQGTYHAVAYAESPPFTVGLWGTVTADGAGGWTATLAGNVDATVQPPTTLTGTYGVASNGRLFFTANSGATFEGGVSASGEFAVAAGPTNEVGGPQLWLFVRR